MTAKKYSVNAFFDLSGTARRWDGATFVDLAFGKRWDGASWNNISGLPLSNALVATASPESAVGFLEISFGTSRTVTSNSVTVSPSGGTGPYTISWALYSGDAGVKANSPSSMSTTFSATLFANTTKQAVMRGTVKDSLNVTKYVYVPVTLTLERVET